MPRSWLRRIRCGGGFIQPIPYARRASRPNAYERVPFLLQVGKAVDSSRDQSETPSPAAMIVPAPRDAPFGPVE